MREPIYCAGHELTAELSDPAPGDGGPWWYAKAFDENQNVVAANGAKTRERALVLVAFELGRYLTAGKGRKGR